MAYLLLLVVATFATTDILNIGLSLAPGLSAKNAVIYLVALCLAFRMVTRGGYRLQLPVIHLWFVVLIGYATVTWLVAGLIIHYQNYELIGGGIGLKNELIDYAIVFGLFFYGTRTISDGIMVTKALLIALTVANAIAIGNVEGIFKIGSTVVGVQWAEAGRVFGTWGNANGTAALIICLLPAYAAVALARRGLSRFAWLLAAVPSAMMLVMTESRGAYVGILLGYGWALFSLRHYLSMRRVILWVGAAACFLALAAVLAGSQFVATLAQRLMDIGSATDIGQSSSGRTDIWAALLGRMMSAPSTLITGFGWNAYSIMGFSFAPHNHYLGLYFELGLIGLLSFVLLARQIVVVARSAIETGATTARPFLMAFVFGFSGLLVAIFFSQIFRPWVYIWAYVGVSLRIAICAASSPAVSSAVDKVSLSEVPRGSRSVSPPQYGRSRVKSQS
jgi:O-antigen ligase